MKYKQNNDRTTSERVTVRVPNHLYDALFDVSKESNMSASSLIVDALSEKLAKMGKISNVNIEFGA